MNIYEKLTNLQNELKAPKNQYNNFGKYKYRNCEDILEAVKPLLLKYKLTQYLYDEIIKVDERYYVRALITLVNSEEPSEKITVSGLAREEENKKGMDSSQLTGSTSSYARKYALSGLYAIDDSKDSDVTNIGENTKNNQQNQQRQTKVPVSENNLNKQHEKRFISTLQAKAMIDLAGGDIAKIKDVIAKLGYKSSTEIEVKDYMRVCEMIKGA